MTDLFPGATALPTLLTERLALRWLVAEDVPALHAVFGDPEVVRYWSSPPLADRAAAAALLEEIEGYFARRELYQWGIARRQDGVVIGTCTLCNVSGDHRRAEIGYALGAAHWGRGYMTEALEVLLDLCFGTLRLNRLEADVDPRNDRSLRLLESLGFVQEGRLRERYRVSGETQDSVMLGLLARDWAARARGSRSATGARVAAG